MNDPYQVLGVSSSASDEEIKRAYHDLARKFHPDNYHDNPLSDLAQEKMKEINEAYDTIMKQRQNGGSGSGRRSSSGSSYGNYGYQGGGVWAQVRNAINANNVSLAEQLLNGVPGADRGAEWNFLMGSVALRKGWLDEARRYYEVACGMEPGNPEYRQALEYMRGGGRAYRNVGGYPGGGMNACDCCSSLICADCCCECMGGDLIRCC